MSEWLELARGATQGGQNPPCAQCSVPMETAFVDGDVFVFRCALCLATASVIKEESHGQEEEKVREEAG